MSANDFFTQAETGGGPFSESGPMSALLAEKLVGQSALARPSSPSSSASIALLIAGPSRSKPLFLLFAAYMPGRRPSSRFIAGVAVRRGIRERWVAA